MRFDYETVTQASPPGGDEKLPSITTSLRRLEEYCASNAVKDEQFKSILSRIKQQVKEAEEIATHPTGGYQQGAENLTKQHEELGRSGRAADLRSNKMRRIPEQRQAQNGDVCEIGITEKAYETALHGNGIDVKGAQVPTGDEQPLSSSSILHEAAKLNPMVDGLARPDLSLKDLANIAARGSDYTRGPDACTTYPASRRPNEFVAAGMASMAADVTEAQAWQTGGSSGRSSITDPSQIDRLSNTGFLKPEMPAQSEKSAEAIDAGGWLPQQQVFPVGSRGEVLYQGVWFAGVVVGSRDQDAGGRYAVQCDVDEEGMLTYTDHFRPLPQSHQSNGLSSSANVDAKSAPQKSEEITLLEQRLAELERQMAMDVQEVASLPVPKYTLNVPISGEMSQRTDVTTAMSQRTDATEAEAAAVAAKLLETPRSAATDGREDLRTMVTYAEVCEARKVAEATAPSSSQVATQRAAPDPKHGEFARIAAARDLAAMKQAAAGLAASAAAAKAAIDLSAFADPIPPKRDLDQAPLTAWAEDAFSQVVGTGITAARRMRNAEASTTSWPSAAPKSTSSSRRHHASSPRRVSTPASPAAGDSLKTAQGESPLSGSFRLVSPSSSYRSEGRAHSPYFKASRSMDSCSSVTAPGKPPDEWDEKDVCSWLKSAASIPAELLEFIQSHAINGLVLLSLSDEDLEALPLTKFGHRRLLVLAARDLRATMKQLQPNGASQVHPSEQKTSGTEGTCGSLSLSDDAMDMEDSAPADARKPKVDSQLPESESRTSVDKELPNQSQVVSSARGSTGPPTPNPAPFSPPQESRSPPVPPHVPTQTPDAPLEAPITKKHVLSSSTGNPAPPSMRRTAGVVSRCSSSPTALLRSSFAPPQRLSSPDRLHSAVRQRSSSPNSRAGSPGPSRHSIAVVASRPRSPGPLGTSQPPIPAEVPLGTSSARGSLRLAATTSRRMGSTMPRQQKVQSPPQMKRSPSRILAGPARVSMKASTHRLDQSYKRSGVASPAGSFSSPVAGSTLVIGR